MLFASFFFNSRLRTRRAIFCLRNRPDLALSPFLNDIPHYGTLLSLAYLRPRRDVRTHCSFGLLPPLWSHASTFAHWISCVVPGASPCSYFSDRLIIGLGSPMECGLCTELELLHHNRTEEFISLVERQSRMFRNREAQVGRELDEAIIAAKAAMQESRGPSLLAPPRSSRPAPAGRHFPPAHSSASLLRRSRACSRADGTCGTLQRPRPWLHESSPRNWRRLNRPFSLRRTPLLGASSDGSSTQSTRGGASRAAGIVLYGLASGARYPGLRAIGVPASLRFALPPRLSRRLNPSLAYSLHPWIAMCRSYSRWASLSSSWASCIRASH